MSSRTIGGSLQMSVMPSDTEIASYRAYAGTRAAADLPSDKEFDVESATIAGTDLHLVEGVTGRLAMAKATLSGASSGVLWGAFMGFVMSFASTNQSAFLQVLFGIAGGALAGTFMSGLLRTMMDGCRDFTSQSQVVVSCYAILASARINQAFELLQRSPGNQVRPRPAYRRPESKGPGGYGPRPDEKPRFGVRLSDGGEDSGAEAPRGNKHTAFAQEPAEAAVGPAEDSQKPLNQKRVRRALDWGGGEGESSDAVQGLDPGEFVAQCIQLDLEVTI